MHESSKLHTETGQPYSNIQTCMKPTKKRSAKAVNGLIVPENLPLTEANTPGEAGVSVWPERPS